MHAFNLACNSQFAIASSCSSSCPWWGVICSCLTSNMASFSFSYWAQATAIRVIHRGGKPKVIPIMSNAVKHCKEVNNYNADICFIQVRGECITWENICGLLCWISTAAKTLFHLWKVTSHCVKYGFVFYNWIEFGKVWKWNGNASELFLIIFISLCFQ